MVLEMHFLCFRTSITLTQEQVYLGQINILHCAFSIDQDSQTAFASLGGLGLNFEERSKKFAVMREPCLHK